MTPEYRDRRDRHRYSARTRFHVVARCARRITAAKVVAWPSGGAVLSPIYRLALIGMEACVGAHSPEAAKLASLVTNARLMPAKYVRTIAKEDRRNDFNDAEAIAEAVQRRR